MVVLVGGKMNFFFFFGGKFGKMDLGKIVLGQRWCNMSL